jgi:hypothetical protein
MAIIAQQRIFAWNAILAEVVFQHISVESLRRELVSNQSLKIL